MTGSHASECAGCRPEIVRRLRLEQCAKCRMLGCDRGPGFSDVAFLAPSMWRCRCRCHPINHSHAAEFLREHVGKNHGGVVTTAYESPDQFERATLTCDCGKSVTYDAGALSVWVPEHDRTDPQRWDGVVA